MNLWIQLIAMLIVILIASQLFTNGLEHIGQISKISTGVTGSIFAAIATALPETSIPLLAIFAGTPDQQTNHEIGVGAILGAPLMLATLSIPIMALFAIKKRGFFARITPEKSGFIRDLNYFLIAFFLAAIAMYAPIKPEFFRLTLSFALIGCYFLYIAATFKASKKLVKEGHGVFTEEPLFFSRLKLKKNMNTMLFQLFVGLVLLVLGAKGFITCIEGIAKTYSLSALVLSLLIIPIATELPEKVNSILWILKNKDTLAMGNITGAMVFQGTLLPAIGILLTPWQPSKEVEAGILVTFLAAAWMRICVSKQGIYIPVLFVNGCLYLLYLYWVLF